MLGLGGGAAVALGVRLVRQANTPPPEPIGDPLTSSWLTAGWIGLAASLLIATCVWISSTKYGFFDGEEDKDGGDMAQEELGEDDADESPGS